jgi:hypothetical protein
VNVNDRARRFQLDPGSTVLTQCLSCRHRSTTGPMQVCAAFPGVIPDEILRNAYDHRRPYLGDDGTPADVGTHGMTSITFAPRDDVPAEVLDRLYAVLDKAPPNA